MGSPAPAAAVDYEARWGDVVRWGDPAERADETFVVIEVGRRRGPTGQQIVTAREPDGRTVSLSTQRMALLERPPLPAALQSEEQFIDAFKRDDTHIAPGRSVLPSDFYIAAYAVDRVCAGPAEGGEWFDAGHVVHASWFPKGPRLCDAVLAELREEWLRVWLRLRDQFDEPDRSNSTGGPHLEVVVTSSWPTSYPDATPTFS